MANIYTTFGSSLWPLIRKSVYNRINGCIDSAVSAAFADIAWTDIRNAIRTTVQHTITDRLNEYFYDRVENL